MLKCSSFIKSRKVKYLKFSKCFIEIEELREILDIDG